MRLVDADKLKEALSSKDLITWTYEYGDAIPVDWLMSTIDNAPTVIERPFCEFKFDKDQLKELVDDAIDKYLRKQEFADFGPYGEWIIEHLPKNINNPNDCYECVSCSECGFHYDYMFHNSNYCPNCGANMRGDKND